MDIYCVVAILTGIIAGFMIGVSYPIINILLNKSQFVSLVKIVIGSVITALAIKIVPSHTWVTVAALCVTCVCTIITTNLLAYALVNKKFQFSGPLNINRGEHTETADVNVVFSLDNN